MKIIKIGLVLVLMLSAFSMSSCGDKNIVQPQIERDLYSTGGKLTFEYDNISHVATFGGEGEVVQFYERDLLKGWDEEGCRIGIQILVPDNLKDYKSGSAKLEGEKLLADDYISLAEGQTAVATFQPIVNENKKDLTLKIIWEEGKTEQTYHIIIKEGTLFMENVE